MFGPKLANGTAALGETLPGRPVRVHSLSWRLLKRQALFIHRDVGGIVESTSEEQIGNPFTSSSTVMSILDHKGQDRLASSEYSLLFMKRPACPPAGEELVRAIPAVFSWSVADRQGPGGFVHL